MGLPSCDLLERLHVCLVPVLNHLGETPSFLEWFMWLSRRDWAGMRTQLCLPPNCQSGKLVPRGLSPLKSIRFSTVQAWIGKEGEAFPETKSLGGSDVLKPEEETETPVHPFRGFFDPE